MTEDQLSRLLHRAADALPPVADPVADVIVRGRRRRLARRAAIGVGSVAALAVVGGIAATTWGGDGSAARTSATPYASDPSAGVASASAPASDAAFVASALHDKESFTLPNGDSVAVTDVRHATFSVPGGMHLLARPDGNTDTEWLLALSADPSATPAGAGARVAADAALLHAAYPTAQVLQQRSAEEIRADNRAAKLDEQTHDAAVAHHPVAIDLPGWACQDAGKVLKCAGPGGRPAVMVDWGVAGDRSRQTDGMQQQGSVPMLGGTGEVVHDPSAQPMQESTGGTDHALGGTTILGPQQADGTYVYVGYYPFAGTTLYDMKQAASALRWR